VTIEAKWRFVLFAGIGYGFHSLVNLSVVGLTGTVGNVTFVILHGLTALFDVWVLSQWYPWLRGKLRTRQS
jgi:hypothetical protein